MWAQLAFTRWSLLSFGIGNTHLWWRYDCLWGERLSYSYRSWRERTRLPEKPVEWIGLLWEAVKVVNISAFFYFQIIYNNVPAGQTSNTWWWFLLNIDWWYIDNYGNLGNFCTFVLLQYFWSITKINFPFKPRYIGLKYDNKATNYTWMDPVHTYSYQTWQPIGSVLPHVNRPGDCVYMDHTQSAGRWVATSCTETLSFICRKSGGKLTD